MHISDVLFIVFGKIIAIIIGLYFFRHLSLAYRLILLQVIVAITTEIVASYIAIVLSSHNVWLFNYYWLLDMWLSGMAGYFLINNQALKKIIPWLLSISTVIWITTVVKNGITNHASSALCIMSIVIVVIYFSLMVRILFTTQNILKAPEFWLSIAIILFFSCSIPFWGLFNYLYKTNLSLLKQLFNIVDVLNFIRYPLIALAFYLYALQQKDTDQTLSTT